MVERYRDPEARENVTLDAAGSIVHRHADKTERRDAADAARAMGAHEDATTTDARVKITVADDIGVRSIEYLRQIATTNQNTLDHIRGLIQQLQERQAKSHGDVANGIHKHVQLSNKITLIGTRLREAIIEQLNEEE